MPSRDNDSSAASSACSPSRLGRSWEPSPSRERSFEVSAWRRALFFFRSLGCRSLVTSSSRPRALLTGHGNDRRRRSTYEDERWSNFWLGSSPFYNLSTSTSTNNYIVGTRSGLVRTSRCEQAFECDGNKVKIN